MHFPAIYTLKGALEISTEKLNLLFDIDYGHMDACMGIES